MVILVKHCTYQDQSSTTAFVSLDRQIIGAVLLELEEETKEAIAKIKAISIHVVTRR